MAKLSHITRCGLPGIEWVPFGMHACHFYSSSDHLVAALVPYTVAGLRGNERCLWITAPLLSAREAVEALRAACNVDDAIHTGALRILDASRLKGLDFVQLWLREEEQALAEGYNGLRIAGDTCFLTGGNWSTFMEYEHAMTAHCIGRRIVMLCSCAIAQCDDQQMSEVMNAHHCVMERLDADWQLLTIRKFAISKFAVLKSAVPKFLRALKAGGDLLKSEWKAKGDSHD